MRYTVLVTDYDGTIAEHGTVSASTVAALQRFREAGGELVLNTGREVQDLQNVFPELAVFHWIIGENGAVLFDLCTGHETLLAQPPPQAFIQLLEAKSVTPLYVGRVIIASFDTQSNAIQEAICELQLDLQVIPNKGASMVLPAHCDKGSGFRAFLRLTGHRKEGTVGVGDAENDVSLLEATELAVALSNALPLLKDKADWIMSKPAGDGVAELIDRLLES